MYQTGLVREEVKKKTDYIMRLIKTVGGYPREITISWSLLEIVACHWGRWVSKEDITKSKQTFMVVLYLIRGPCGQRFCYMVMDFFCWKISLKGRVQNKKFHILWKKSIILFAPPPRIIWTFLNLGNNWFLMIPPPRLKSGKIWNVNYFDIVALLLTLSKTKPRSYQTDGHE